jgi:hypothetical protein
MVELGEQAAPLQRVSRVPRPFGLEIASELCFRQRHAPTAPALPGRGSQDVWLGQVTPRL